MPSKHLFCIFGPFAYLVIGKSDCQVEENRLRETLLSAVHPNEGKLLQNSLHTLFAALLTVFRI